METAKIFSAFSFIQWRFGSVMVSKLGKQTFMNELESHWALHSYGFLPHLSKKLCRKLFIC